LSADDFSRINPNTLTCPVFRARRDAELTRKIYQQVPVLIREARGTLLEQNPWGIRFMAMFHMSNDSHLFYDEGGTDRLPLYEGKMVQAFDHRAASVKTNLDNIVRAGQPDPTSLDQYEDHNYSTTPQSWVSASEVELTCSRCLGSRMDTGIQECYQPYQRADIYRIANSQARSGKLADLCLHGHQP
jgi:hypothetical protein